MSSTPVVTPFDPMNARRLRLAFHGNLRFSPYFKVVRRSPFFCRSMVIISLRMLRVGHWYYVYRFKRFDCNILYNMTYWIWIFSWNLFRWCWLVQYSRTITLHITYFALAHLSNNVVNCVFTVTFRTFLGARCVVANCLVLDFIIRSSDTRSGPCC